MQMKQGFPISEFLQRGPALPWGTTCIYFALSAGENADRGRALFARRRTPLVFLTYSKYPQTTGRATCRPRDDITGDHGAERVTFTMNGEKRSLVILVQAGMELSWLNACISFVVAALVGQALPFSHALAVFTVAVIVGHLSLGRGWRNYLVLIVQTACLGGALMTAVYALYYSSYTIFSYDWILLAFHGPHQQKGMGGADSSVLVSRTVLDGRYML